MYICVWVYERVCGCVCAYVRVCTRRYIIIDAFVLSGVRVCMCMCVYACACVCACACVRVRVLRGQVVG